MHFFITIFFILLLCFEHCRLTELNLWSYYLFQMAAVLRHWRQINHGLPMRKVFLISEAGCILKRTISTSIRVLKSDETSSKQDTSKIGEQYFPDTTYSLKTLSTVPKPALYLGFGGAIPFVSLAWASGIFTNYNDLICLAQTSYAACILTFLGGVHWGKALGSGENDFEPTWSRMTYSILPSLYAWVAFSLPQTIGLYYLSAGLLIAYAVDAREKRFPSWYRALRVPLTIFGATSVAVTGYNLSL